MDSSWLSENSKWLFGALCSVVGGGFALIKWLDSRRKKTEPQSQTGDNLSSSEQSSYVIHMGTDSTISGQVMVGSNNVQNVILGHTDARTPPGDQKPSSPTGNEIRQRQDDVLNGIPLYMRDETIKRFWDSFTGVSVSWPVRIYSVRDFPNFRRRDPDGSEDDLLVEARYGEETWGAIIEFSIKSDKFPFIKTLSYGHKAFIEGQIQGINGREITITISNLEAE